VSEPRGHSRLSPQPRSARRGRNLASLSFLSLLAIGACAFDPPSPAPEAWGGRRQIASDRGVTVGIAILSAAEAETAFDADLAAAGMQAIWLEVQNDEDSSYVLLSRSLDERYFTPAEAAMRLHRAFAPWHDSAIDAFLRDHAMPVTVPPRATVRGFVYVGIDRGHRLASVELLGSHRFRRVDFMVDVGDLDADYDRPLLRAAIASADRESLDLAELRARIESLPRCVTSEDGEIESDPVNLVIVGHAADVFPAFLRAGWDETEVMAAAAAYETIASMIGIVEYRYAPFSALYLFGRAQDIGLQKARETPHERSHLRLWSSPWSCEGKPVWVGHASRDIGVKFTLSHASLMTHVLDPDVDRERQYVVQDLIAAQAVERVAFAAGAGKATLDAPRVNLSGDPYFTDGLRAVIFVGSGFTTYTEVELLDWAETGFVR
jgi:hypothetical protein